MPDQTFRWVFSGERGSIPNIAVDNLGIRIFCVTRLGTYQRCGTAQILLAASTSEANGAYPHEVEGARPFKAGPADRCFLITVCRIPVHVHLHFSSKLAALWSQILKLCQHNAYVYCERLRGIIGSWREASHFLDKIWYIVNVSASFCSTGLVDEKWQGTQATATHWPSCSPCA